MADSLLPMPLTENTVHLCVDMQRIFSNDGPWATPWMERVLPVVAEIAGRFPERTVFTRFITPHHPEDMPGMWRRYYERWRETTREHVDPRLLELMPPLARLAPPATVIDKTRYSAFTEPGLLAHLRHRGADGLIDHRIGDRCLCAGDRARRGRSGIPRHRRPQRGLQLVR
jgi:nicotinamidase-related amidase